MSVLLQCSRCGREMHSSGIRGMCPQCLFACSTVRFEEPGVAAPTGGEDLVSDMAVGPDNRFLLLDKLGEGGMGEVWLADDRELSQPGEPSFVALKFLSQSIRHNPRAMQAIRLEVRRSQALTHPNVVRIHDLHTTRTGLPFISMEYVEGNSLSQWLRNHPHHVMPWRLVVMLTRQLASALLYAHETAGIVHRDLKPANLLLAQGNILKLSDFGLSQALGPSAFSGELPAGGTLAYAGPQQVSGEPPAAADDVYSVGATLYELLTGTTPFQAEYLDDLLIAINSATPEPIPQRLQALGRSNEVPAKLSMLVQRCLEKDPIYRPKTAELARLLPYVEEAAPRNKPAPSPVTMEVEPSSTLAARVAEWFWRTAFALVLLALGAYVFDVGQTRNWVRQKFQALTDRMVENEASQRASVHPESPIPPLPVPASNSSTPQEIVTQSPVAVASGGQLQLQIDSAIPFQVFECRAEVTTNSDKHFTWQLPRGATNLALPAGDYLMHVMAGGSKTAQKDAWVVSRPFKIEKNVTSRLRIPFREENLTLDTVPPGATLYWNTGLTNLGHSPYTARFRSGSQEFTARMPGYRLFITNFFFDPQPGQSAQCTFFLQRNLFPVAGEDWTNSLGMAFRWVQEIHALVAVTETRRGDYRQFANSGEAPTLAADFYTLTTNGWQQVGDSWAHPGFIQTDDHPAVGLSWEDAFKFCEWLTKLERGKSLLAPTQVYALPTVAQWIRLVGGTRFPWGTDLEELPRDVNYAGGEARRQDWPLLWPVLGWHEDLWMRTAPVRTGPSSRHGLYGLAGNAAEWCAEKVLCGGSWFDGEWYTSERNHFECLETAHTSNLPPSRRDPRNGFRMMIPLADSADTNAK